MSVVVLIMLPCGGQSLPDALMTCAMHHSFGAWIRDEPGLCTKQKREKKKYILPPTLAKAEE